MISVVGCRLNGWMIVFNLSPSRLPPPTIAARRVATPPSPQPPPLPCLSPPQAIPINPARDLMHRQPSHPHPSICFLASNWDAAIAIARSISSPSPQGPLALPPPSVSSKLEVDRRLFFIPVTSRLANADYYLFMGIAKAQRSGRSIYLGFYGALDGDVETMQLEPKNVRSNAVT